VLERRVSSTVTSSTSEGPHAFTENSHGKSALLRLAELAEEFEAEQVAADARSVAEPVSEGRFYVACIGQFKRGKSSVLNALVGDSVLPTGVVPVTTVPTIIRYGSYPAARVRFEAGAWTMVTGGAVAGFGIFTAVEGPQSAWGLLMDASFVFWGLVFVIAALRWR
jgi:hypothetical protein